MMANKRKNRINFCSEEIDVLSTLQSHMHLQEYIPTALLLSPPIQRDHYAVGGIVLDGHYKIQAAAKTRCPIRVILIENKDHDGCVCGAFENHLLNPTSEFCDYCMMPLNWVCDLNYIVKHWKRKEELKKNTERKK